MQLQNKIALITGGASGIGAATAEEFVARGATVIITDINDEQGEALAQKLGDNALFMHLDVSAEDEWQALCANIKKRFHHLDILFNNAGVIGFADTTESLDPEHCSLENWHYIHKINLDGVFLGCKHGIRLMKEAGGSIINMSSRSGMVGIPTACGYASSKASVRNHTKTVAIYCANQGYDIRCNSVHPAAILTPLWDPMLAEQREAMIKEISAGIPMQRMGTAHEVATVVAFLASEDSSYMTGAELVIDGGILAGAASCPGRDE